MNDAYYNKLPEMHELFHDLKTMDLEDSLIWKPIATAPKTGIEIEVSYGDGSDPKEITWAFWSDRPVCMGGPTVYIKPGWATGHNSGTDYNLPLDEPKMWRNPCY